MTIFNTFDNLINNLAATADFAKEASKAAVRNYCSIRAKYPTTTSVFTPLDFIADGVCSRFGVPPAPRVEPPFIGGQCQGAWRVEGRYLNANTRGAGCEADLKWTVSRIVGVVTGVGIDTSEIDPTGALFLVLFYIDETGAARKEECIGVSGAPLNIVAECEDLGVAGSFIALNYGFSITDVIPLDETPNDCGNPPLSPPPDPDFEPEDFRSNFDLTINTFEGDKNYNFEIIFDPERINWRDDIPFVIYDPNSNKSFDGDIGKEGVDIDPEGSKDGNEGGNPTGDGNSTEVTLYEVPFTTKRPYIQVEEEEVEDKEQEMEPGEIAFVLIQVTELPKGDRQILFENSENNTFFAGYIAWTITTPNGKFRYPEMPIRKEKNAFEVPPNVNGYVVYAVNYAKLKVTEYKVEVPVEGEE